MKPFILIFVLSLVCASGHSADYLSPLQAPQVQKQVSPVQKAIQAPFQAPIQKAVQSPVQKSAVQKGSLAAAVRPLRLFERRRAARAARREALRSSDRLVALGLFGGC